ncbi:MAG: hypothetical protein PWR18_1127 [Synergistales bacterium]|nr:hypothetical protein [Synergistales bacterium]
MKLPEISVRRPAATLMLFIGVIIIGSIVLTTLNIDLLPEIEPPVITVLTGWPGSSATDVEQRVTKIMEDDLAMIEGVEDIISKSLDGISAVSVRFEWGTDLDVRTGDVRDAVSMAKYDLPDDAEEPIILRITSGTVPVIEMSMTAEKTFDGLYYFADNVVAQELSQVPGVGQVLIFGGKSREIRISLDADLLEAYRLSTETIARVLESENINIPSGSLDRGETEYFVRVPGRFSSVEEIKDIVVGSHEGRPITMDEVADVSDTFRDPIMHAWQGDHEALVLIVMKNTDANSVNVANGVIERMKKLKEERFPEDVTYNIVMNTADFITSAIKNLAMSLVVGIVLVFLVTWIFLKRLPASLVVCGAIPFSLILTFIAMGGLEYTINIFTLSALAMASGMVVDNAVVATDQIIFHIEKGERKKTAAILGAGEVGPAMFASTLTTVVVLLPLAFITGLVGVFFESLTVVMVLAVSSSLFVSLTFIPMMGGQFFHVEPGKLFVHRWTEKFFSALENTYKDILLWSLSNWKKVLALALVLMAMTLLSFRFVGTELTPEPDTGDILITFHMPEGTRIEETDRVVREIIAYCEQNVAEAKYVFGFDGREEEGFTIAVGQEAGPNIGTVGLSLVDKNERDRSAFEIAEGIRRWIRGIPRIEKMTVLVTSPIKAMFLGSKPLSVEVYGENLEEVRSVADAIAKRMDSVPGAVDVAVSQKEPRPEIHVDVDREKAALLGVRTASVGEAMRTYFFGYLTDQDYWEGEDNYPIRVRLEESQKDDIEIFSRLLVPSVTGQPVRLSNIASIREDEGPPQIDRKNRQRYITVDANVQGRSLSEVTADVMSLMDQLKIPPGVRVEFGGEVEEQRKAFTQMGYLVLLGILLVYMVMAGQYEAYLDPLVIMFSVPFALTGVVAAYLLTGLYLSLQGVLGIIMLVGMVVNIAIVLVDYINLTRARGTPLRDALVQAGVRRLRPALMTTFTTFFGMLPMAVSQGQGAELWRPLAVSVMGGLVVSMLVTLVLVPVLYSLVEERIRRRPRFVEAREVTEE